MSLPAVPKSEPTLLFTLLSFVLDSHYTKLIHTFSKLENVSLTFA
jgi:hypothetical protein